MSQFELVSEYELTGDQPKAVAQLAAGVDAGEKAQVLLGVTGSGKTFSIANVIAQTQRPTLIVAHNKTLAAQLYAEFRELFPRNAVEYFVSYYDYYQPEAYIPRTDTYIEKDAMINERIDKMRHSATRSLLDRQDVIIVASVSCIYGLGSPEAYHQMLVYLEKGMTIDRDAVLAKLIEIQYKRSDAFLERGRFRVRGDVLDVFPVYEDSKVVRVEFFGDEVDSITLVDPLTGEILEEMFKSTIYPASHYVQPQERLEGACTAIEAELETRLLQLKEKGKLLEAQRLEQRTRYDLEMIREIGFCSGIENYSRHLEGRLKGSTPPTLMDYLPSNALIVIDESHATVPQIGGMYRGDQSRKNVLVDHGFRLESALDNRPLKFEEFEAIANRLSIVYVSATPAKYELERAGGVTAEQVIRPTGLMDPEIEVRPARGQVDDLLDQARAVIEAGHRVLVTTLTKRMAEDLTEYYRDCGINVRYLHADIETIERTELIKQLRLGEYDVLVGINLLREGLDIPEVALVGVLDADKEGFLRSTTSLIQTSGRAARNSESRVIFYADKVTDSMKSAMDETARRREIQGAYNEKHGIIPTTIRSRIKAGIEALYDADYVTVEPDIDNRINAILARADDSLKSRKGRAAAKKAQSQASQSRAGAKSKTKAAAKSSTTADSTAFTSDLTTSSIPKRITQLRDEMGKAAKRLEFELAAQIRDEIRELEQLQMELL